MLLPQNIHKECFLNLVHEGYRTTITATNSEDEPWRIGRLNRLVGAMLADPTIDLEVFNDIANIHDHKGLITVTWFNKHYVGTCVAERISDLCVEDMVFGHEPNVTHVGLSDNKEVLIHIP